MEKTLISWNVPNMITVWLMLAIGFLVLTFVGSKARAFLPGKAGDNSAGGY